VPDAGHVPWVGRPNEVAAAVLAFLQQHTNERCHP
jgi:pimeloyl-ACP methyl ester carboxylesterase